MSLLDNGPDDWVPVRSAPLSRDSGPDDWVPVAPAATVRPTAAMPPVQDFSEQSAPESATVSGLRQAGVMPPVQDLDLPPPRTDMPPVAELDDAPFRSIMGGERVPGTEDQAGRAGMLTGEQAYQSRQDSIRGAEQAVAEAEERLAAAVARQRAVGANLAQRGTPGHQQRLYVDAEVSRADENLTNARRALAAAERAAPPTMTPLRAAAAKAAQTVGTAVPDTIGSAARLIDAPLESAGLPSTGTAEWMRARSKEIEQANPLDATLEDSFAVKLGGGIGSAAAFIATGIAGRAAGLSQAVTSGVAGGLQQAEQYYREADDLGVPAYKKAMAYITGGAIGATEAFGIGSTLDRINAATGGGVRRYFGVVAREGGEEAVQEATQQLLDNIAKYGLFGKDPGDITKDVAENALVGAVLGMGMGGTLGARSLIPGRKAVDQAIPVPEQVPDPNAPQSGLSTAEQVLSSSPVPPSAPPPAAPAAAVPPPLPASAPSAPSAPVPLSPVEQRILTSAGLTPEQIATMSREELDAAIEMAGERAAAPTAPLDTATTPQPVSHETVPVQPTVQLDVQPPPVTPSPVEQIAPQAPPPPNRLDLQAMLDDPRSAAEIKADMEAARNWRPTDDWQAVPTGVALDPALEVRTIDGVQQARIAPAPGTRAAPVQLQTPEDVHTGAEVTAQPTPAQAESGNYSKRHAKWQGFDISIETEAGQARTGIGADGVPWSVTMPAPYGYFRGTEARDGDHVDVYIGPQPNNGKAFVIDQVDPRTGKYDEAKVVIGVPTIQQARRLYTAAFSDGLGDARIGAVTEMSAGQLKTWLTHGNTKKPLAYKPRADAKTAGIQLLAEDQGSLPAPDVAGLSAVRGQGDHNPSALGEQLQKQGIRAAYDQLFNAIETRQTDKGVEMFSLAEAPNAPGFYSAVARAIGDVKLNKAPPAQWLNTIRNLPGVKAEELEWLGLDDWLKEQKGVVTKEQLHDYIRANQIEIKEVEKGGSLTDEEVRDYHDISEETWDEAEAWEQDQMRREAQRGIYADSVESGGAESPTKYASYTLPGGENYRELLLTLPAKKPEGKFTVVEDGRALHVQRSDGYVQGSWTNDGPEARRAAQRHADNLNSGAVPVTNTNEYRSSHWDEPNILTHIRFNDRTIDGKKTLFIEEVQSDWHQQGKRTGYAHTFKDSDLTFDRREGLIDQGKDKFWFKVEGYKNHQGRDDVPGWGKTEAEARADALRWVNNPNKRAAHVPDAPFKTTWPELAMKRMIRYAAEKGYDQIAWTPGDVQAERYDLSKQIDTIKFTRANKDAQGGKLLAIDKNNVPVISDSVSLERLPDIIGKEAADKLLKQDFTQTHASGTGYQTLENADLKVGGEGMRGFYDKILPATVNKLVKKFGAKVGQAPLRTEPGNGFDMERQPNGEWHVFDVRNPDEVVASFDKEHQAQEFIDENGPVVPGEGKTVHTLPITSSLREAAMGEGFPLFKQGEGGFTSEFTEAADQIGKVLRDELDRLGLHDVALKIEDTIQRTINGQTYQAHGSYLKGVIRIALDSNAKFNTLHHEALHALRKMDLFTDGEWSILERAAEKWRGQYDINRRYAHTSESQRDEEAVAHAYAAWADGSAKPSDGRIVRLFKRIQQFLTALRNGLRGEGFKTAESIFRDIDKGKIGNRTTQGHFLVPEALAASEEEGADGKPQLVIPGAERMSEREINRRKMFQAKKRPAQKDTSALPLFSDEKDQGEMFAIRTPAEEAVLKRVVPSETGSRFRNFTWRKMYTAIKDDLHPIKLLERELIKGANLPSRQSHNPMKRLWEGKGSPLAAKDSPYTLARLTRGNAGRAAQWLEYGTYDYATLRDTGKGLKQILKPVKNDLDGIRAYAVAKRTLELEGRGIKTGVPINEAQDVVTHGKAKYDDVFNDLVAYQRRLTEYLHDAGILSDEGFAAMLSANKDYVPFFRMMDDKTELGAGVIGRNLKVRDPVRGIRGSERQIIDPIESIIKNTYLFISLAERNRALTALADLAAKSPAGADLFEKAKPGVHPIEVSEREINKFLTAQGVAPAASNAMTIFRPNTFRPSPTEVAVFRDGKREIYSTSPEVAEAVNALDRESINLLTKILSVPARTLRAGAVLAPEFIARNPARDQFDALIYSKYGYIPIYDTIKGLGAILTPDGSKAYQAWLKSGGSGAAMVGIDRDYINENIMRLEKPGALNRIKNVVDSPLKALRLLSELTENATRVGIHMRAAKKTNDPFETGMVSREGTLDFSRWGPNMRALNAVIPFLNAGLEGKDRMVRAFKDRPLATTTKALAAITLPSVLLWAANHDDDRWKELEAWQRDLFWIILTDKWEPYRVQGDDGKLRDATDEDIGNRAKRTYFRKIDGKWMRNNGTIWRIPKPFELGIIFGSLPERFLDAYFKVRPDAYKQGFKSLLSAAAPGFIPQGLLPVLEQATNHSFFRDRALVPKYMENIESRYQSTPYTTETAKKIGALLSKATDKSISSPIIIENYVRQWSGTLGMSALQLVDQGIKAAGMSETKTLPEKTLADMPVVRAFVARHPSAGLQSIQDFYEEYFKRKKNVETLKYLRRAGEAEAADEVATRPLETAENVRKALSARQKFIRGVYLNKEMTASEKRTLIDNSYLDMIEFARAGLDAFRKSEKRPE